MQDLIKIPLVSSEIVGIWNSFMDDSMAICVLKHFINNTDDDEIRPIVQHALNLSSRHIPKLTNFFNQEGLPLPDGFKENDDLNTSAPRLFGDQFYLVYLSYMARLGMQRYSQVLGHTGRSDLRDYFSKCINESVDLYNMVSNTRLSKGTFIRAPHIEVPKSVQYIEDKSFLSDWFDEKRPMIVREITHISSNMLSNIVGRAVTTGFGQVCKKKEVVEYMFRGRDLSAKRIEIFSSILTKENIPVPSTYDSYVTDSTTAPFSEKLMMFHTLALTSSAIIDYGTAMADNLRSDIQATYARLASEIFKYTSEGANIMIKNKWLEQPPQAINHENLVRI